VTALSNFCVEWCGRFLYKNVSQDVYFCVQVATTGIKFVRSNSIPALCYVLLDSDKRACKAWAFCNSLGLTGGY